ncbi:hypothetical protein DUNSADRAFT_17306 [Dunaliella salina]|uniref:DUF4440 domain-containing protein n=1 Tax=Dunaliella salina TaxID=3046 RepID=A0ABQ7G206_DUNSA|nr:hypothetical protein DUNSADRAFT_17306 [Dunaliella salina]|eukprot:KAF5828632.1 hypothetical protein DUNSADRAFT_17306 [Dunaliella salina]
MDEPVHAGSKPAVDLHRLVPPGASPTEVADLYFKACYEGNPKLFLATCHLDLRGNSSSGSPGPFHKSNWELGRLRVEKYKVTYKLVREANRGGEQTEGYVSLHYTPLFGPVPGYEEGAALGPVVILTMKRAQGEWRVANGEF